MRQFEEEGSELTPRGEESGRAEKGDVLVGRSGRRRSIAWLYEAPSASDSGRRLVGAMVWLAGRTMRHLNDRPAISPLALPPVCYARGSSCPQCGRGHTEPVAAGHHSDTELSRRPQCGQQLQPSPTARGTRAKSTLTKNPRGGEEDRSRSH